MNIERLPKQIEHDPDGIQAGEIKSSGIRQAFREALSTFGSKNALFGRLGVFRYDEFLSGQIQAYSRWLSNATSPDAARGIV